MRTLREIVSAAKGNEPVEVEELLYAVCALSSLSTFDQMDLRRMASDEKDGKPCLRAWSRFKESFRRWKLALDKSPKEWLGPGNDPASPEYQRRRALANRILEAAIDGTLRKKLGLAGE
jgi:hypothetical protein